MIGGVEEKFLGRIRKPFADDAVCFAWCLRFSQLSYFVERGESSRCDWMSASNRSHGALLVNADSILHIIHNYVKCYTIALWTQTYRK